MTETKPATGENIRRDYPVSLLAVGLSLGGTDPLDAKHFGRLKSRTGWIELGLIYAPPRPGARLSVSISPTFYPCLTQTKR